MGLVNELQVSAERDDVATVLRKAKRLSSKLGLRGINEWLDHEQSGYPEDAEVPKYRTVAVSFHYDTNGYIPAGYGMLHKGIMPLHGFGGGWNTEQRVPISTIQSHIAAFDKDEAIYFRLPDDVADFVRERIRSDIPGLVSHLTLLGKLSENHVRNIPEHVKNRVLDWACELEAAGVTGDGVSFSAEEKDLAQGVVFNITDCRVEQIAGSGRNLIRRPR